MSSVLPEPGTIALDHNAAQSVLRRHGWQHPPAVVRRHPSSGRNRIFDIENLHGERLLLKQLQRSRSARHQAELLVELAANGLALPVEFLDAETASIAMRVDRNLVPLHVVADADPIAAVVALATLGPFLAKLHTAPLEKARQADLAQLIPSLDPVDYESWAAMGRAGRDFVAQVQQRPRLTAMASELRADPGPTGLIHGDIKLDNILVSTAGTYLIDWELSGHGPTGLDLGAAIGSVLLLWIDNLAYQGSSNENEWLKDARVPFGAVRSAANRLVNDYVARSAAPLDLQSVAHHTSLWLVMRSWAQAFALGSNAPRTRMLLLVAENLLLSPDELLGDAPW